MRHHWGIVYGTFICLYVGLGIIMFTHNYKGYFIHGYFDKPQCTVSGFEIDHKRVFKSYRAAQLAITKAAKKHDDAMMTSCK